MVASKYANSPATSVVFPERELARRPDIEHINLNCANTNTVLPAIDLVNELLEQRALWVSNQPRGISASNPGFADDVDFENAGTNSGVETSRQTTWTTEQLLAHPEHLNLAAYELLRETSLPADRPDPSGGTVRAELAPPAVAPWLLPFDLFLEEARGYLRHLGIERGDLIRLYRPGDVAAIAQEHLGISAGEYRLLVNREIAPASQAVSLDMTGLTLAGLAWGYYDNYEELGEPKRFLRQTGLELNDALNLIDTWYAGALADIGDVYKAASVTFRYGPDRCSLEGAEFGIVDNDSSLSGLALSRIHRFVRLQRAVGWTSDELDQALRVLARPTGAGADLDALNEDTLVELGHVTQLKKRFSNVPIMELLAWLGPIEWQPSADGATPAPRYSSDGTVDRVTLYDRWFLDKSRSASTALQLDTDGETSGGVFISTSPTRRILASEMRPFVAGALGANDADLSAIDAEGFEFPAGSPAPAVSRLSMYVQRVKLAQALRLSVEDVLWLERRSGIALSDAAGGFVSAQDLRRFVALVDTLRATVGFDRARIEYWLNDVPFATQGSASFELDRASAGALLHRIRTGITEHAATVDQHLFDELVAGLPPTTGPDADLVARASMLAEIPKQLEQRLLEVVGDEQLVQRVTAIVNELPAAGTPEPELADIDKSLAVAFYPFLDLSASAEPRPYLAFLIAIEPATAAERSLAVLTHLEPYRNAQQIEAFVIQSVASEIGLEPGICGDLLRTELSGIPGEPDPTTGLEILSSAPSVIPAIYFPPAESRTAAEWAHWLTINSAAHRVFRWLHRTQAILAGTRLGFDETIQMLSTRASAAARVADELGVIDFPAWFDVEQPNAELTTRFHAVLKTLNIVDVGRGSFGSATSLFAVLREALDYLDDPGTPNPVVNSIFHNPVVAATGWDADELRRLTGTTDASAGDGYLRLGTGSGTHDYVGFADIVEFSVFARMRELFAIRRRTSVVFEQSYSWVVDVGDASKPLTETVTSLQAATIKEYVRSRFDQASWVEVIRPLRDELREKQRDALMAYIEAHGPESVGHASLYDELLLDPLVSSCVLTSRIKAALGSIQLLIQRSTLDLEPDFEVLDDLATNWDWMGRYRIWEANRKVFLYPENWLRPEWRRDKSELFRRLEAQLSEGELTEATIEQAYMNYLYGLEEVSNLTITGILRQQIDDSEEEQLHLFGLSAGKNPKAFHRVRVGGVGRPWGTWAQLPFVTSIYGVLPVVFQRRVMLFWLAFEPVRTERTKEQRDADVDPIPYDRISLVGSELRNGQWSEPIEYASSLLGFVEYDAGTGPSPDTDLDVETPTYNDLKDEDGITDNTGQNLQGTGNASGKNKEYFGPPVCVPARRSRLYLEENNTGSLLRLRLKFRNLNSDKKEKLKRYPGTFVIGEWWFRGCAREPTTRFQGRQVATPYTPSIWEPRGQRFVSSRKNAKFYVDVASRCNGTQTQGTAVLAGLSEKHAIVRQRKDGSVRQKDLYIYQDPQRSMLFENLGRETGDNDARGYSSGIPQVVPEGPLRFAVHLMSHPFLCDLIRQLNADGIDGIFRASGSLRHQAKKVRLWSSGGSGEYELGECVRTVTPAGETVSTYHEFFDFSPQAPGSTYNWELFFHIPILIADRLRQEQRFEEARRWLQYVFDPTAGRESNSVEANRFWMIKPFRVDDVPSIRDLLAEGSHSFFKQLTFNEKHPFDPHGVARLRVTSYMYSTLMAYLDNLIEWADQLFRQETIESINEATLLYLQAAAILGDRPTVLPAEEREDASFADGRVDAFGSFFGAAESELGVVPPLGIRPGSVGHGDPNQTPIPDGPSLIGVDQRQDSNLAERVLDQGGDESGGRELIQYVVESGDGGAAPYFCMPPNPRMLAYWDTLEDRLFKVRNCLTLEGRARAFRLFEPPIDPAALIQALNAGVDLASAVADLNAPAPHYRFTTYLGLAKDFVAELGRFGSSLLAALEKRDAEALAGLRAGHEVQLLQRVRSVLEARETEAIAGVQALKNAIAVTEERRVFYTDRERYSVGERIQLAALGKAAIAQFSAAVNSGLAALFSFAPQVTVGVCAGTETGGVQLSAVASATAQLHSGVAAAVSTLGNLAGTNASFARRDEEWSFLAEQAVGDIRRLEADLEAAEARVVAAQRELARHDQQYDQARDVERFLQTKYSQTELYEWMASELSRLYFESYQLAFDVAKRAQRCYQRELAVSSSESSFVTFGYWNSRRKGLLAGEALGQALRRLEASYYERNEREFELTKRISLAELDPLALLELRETGSCRFHVPESMFDLDHAGHYLRRIKTVSLSVPAVVGPYINVNCSLSLLRSALRAKPAVDEPLVADLVGGQRTIATSSGDGDAGLFEASLSDPRYLPFETKGVDSHWELKLPNTHRQFDYATISDVVLTIRYTARDGGEAFANDVSLAITDPANEEAPALPYRLVSARHSFVNAWYAFKQANAEAFAEEEDELVPLVFELSLDELGLRAEDVGPGLRVIVVSTHSAGGSTPAPTGVMFANQTSAAQFAPLDDGGSLGRARSYKSEVLDGVDLPIPVAPEDKVSWSLALGGVTSGEVAGLEDIVLVIQYTPR